MDYKNILLFVAGGLDLLLGFLILYSSKRKEINISYFLFALGVAFWSIFIGLFRMSDIYYFQLFFNQIFIISSAFLLSGFFHFSLVFCDEKNNVCKKMYWWQRILIYLPNIFIILMVFSPGVMIKDIVIRDWGNESILGWGYIYFGIYFGVLWIIANTILFNKFLKAKGIFRVQLFYVLFGLLIAFIFGATFNLIFILLGNYKWIWFGPMSSFIMISAIGYAIIKHHLMSIKVIATEVFSAFLVILTFVQIFQTSVLHVGFRVAIFLITLVFAVLLVRSVLNEIKRREQLEILNNKLKQTTINLEKANKELQRLDDAKSEFLSIASHQLRTPTTIIKGYISMMQEGSFGKVSKTIKQNLDKVYQATERLLNLIENLLDISRIEAGRLEFNLQSVDLGLVVESLIDDFQKKAKDKKIKLELFVPNKLPKVLADINKIKEVASNLIDNAVKYTPKGEVVVGLHQEGSSVVFTVSDTGLGIAIEDLSRLFNKFVRGKDMNRIHTEGTGLGLYFARVVIENMGGRIWAESAGKGQGSKFCFSLPLADKKKAKKVNI